MKRIQRRRTKGWRMPDGAVYVGRPSRWGNPYVVTFLGRPAPGAAASLFFRFIQPTLDITPLRDATALACWCGLCEAHTDGLPAGVKCLKCMPCHGDGLAVEACA